MTPKKLDWQSLPPHLRDNWHLCLSVRSEALRRYTAEVRAAAGLPDNSPVNGILDIGAIEMWRRVNPMPEQFASGNWPPGAAVVPPDEYFEQALKLLGMWRAEKA